MIDAIALLRAGLSQHPGALNYCQRQPERALKELGDIGTLLLSSLPFDELQVLLRHAEGILEQPVSPELILTVPPRIQHSLGSVVTSKFRTTRNSIYQLMRKAAGSVFMIAPYCHPGVVADIAPGLLEACQRGAKVRIFVRRHDEWNNQPFVNALYKAVAGYDVIVQEILDEDHLSHAKVIIADQSKAYVGSGNLTPHGYGHNLEAGVIVTGHIAQDLQLALRSYVDLVGKQALSAKLAQ